MEHEHVYHITGVDHNSDGTVDITMTCSCGEAYTATGCWPESYTTSTEPVEYDEG